MKKLLILILLFCSLVNFGKAEEVTLNNNGSSIKDLVPKDWKTLLSTSGDLNKDGLEDLVFVIQDTDSSEIKPSDGFGTKTIDLNPRILAIYFKNNQSNNYEKQIQMNEFITLRDSPTMDEPLDSIEITENGVLKIRFNFWYSAGSWSMSNSTYQFRYQNNHFYLIGYDRFESHRGTGNTTDYSINFLSKKMSISHGNFSEDKPSLIEWKEFKLDTPIRVKDMNTETILNFLNYFMLPSVGKLLISK